MGFHRDGDVGAVAQGATTLGGAVVTQQDVLVHDYSGAWTRTVAVVPMRSGRLGSGFSMRTRTGTRCVTLTQLPVAFCAGSSEKDCPAPPDRLCTSPAKVLSGYMSATTRAFWPTCTRRSSVSLKLASTQYSSS